MFTRNLKSQLKKTFLRLWKNEKGNGENIRLQVTESLHHLARSKLGSTLNPKELNSHSHLPWKITWLCVGPEVQEF